MIENLKEKTGKSLEEWTALLKTTSLEKHGEMVKYLKTEHGVTHGYANTIVLKAREADAASFSEEDLVGTQYKGKDTLVPVYDAIMEFVKGFGNGLEIAPKKANVSLRRKYQFALVQPTTKTRIDLGLKLRNRDPEGRLETSGPFGTMCTHRVRLESVDDFTDEVKSWLTEAWEEAEG